MRLRLFYCQFLLVLELSRAFQPINRPRHWSSTTTTRLDFSPSFPELDPSLVPALTASVSLFVGAAGTLFYNRFLEKQQKEALARSKKDDIDIDALNASLATIVPTQQEQLQAQEELMDFQAEINEVLKDADVAIMDKADDQVDDKAETDDDDYVPKALLETLAKQNNGETTVATSMESIVSTDTSVSGDIIVYGQEEKSSDALLETLSKQNNGEMTATVETSMDDIVSADEIVPEPNDIIAEQEEKSSDALLETLGKQNSGETATKTSVKDIEFAGDNTVSAPTVSTPTKDDITVEQEKSTDEPSLVSLKESSKDSETVASTQAQESVVAETKEAKPSFVASTQAPADTTVKETKPKEDLVEKKVPEPQATVASVGSVEQSPLQATSIPAESVSKTPVPINDAATKKTTSLTKKLVPRKARKEVATSSRIQPKVKKDTPSVAATQSTRTIVTPPPTRVATKEAASAAPANSLRSPPKSTVTSMPTPVARNAAANKTRVKKQTAMPKPQRPQSTRDIMNSISSKATMTRSSDGRGVSTKPPPTTQQQRQPVKPVTNQRQPVKAAVETTTSSVHDDDKEDEASLKTSLSMLTRKETSPGNEEDYDEAMVSLHRHIQNQARDMTRERMTAKIASSGTSDIPGFIAPEVESHAVPMATLSSIQVEEDEQQESVSPTDSASDEQVARMLKKQSRISRITKARKSVVLVALTTGVVVVGKRLAATVIGRGLL